MNKDERVRPWFEDEDMTSLMNSQPMLICCCWSIGESSKKGFMMACLKRESGNAICL